jgi:hypothetical protein
LHYQEAFAFWHRAYLLYVEELIDFPIPYWNGLNPATADPQSPLAGLPSIFLEETYVHPSGQVRPNPLKYALALDGASKGDPNSKWVMRDPILVHGPTDPGWTAKINLFKIYQAQVAHALSQGTYSQPEDITTYSGKAFGVPWANLPAFSDQQPDELYPYRSDFDGLVTLI